MWEYKLVTKQHCAEKYLTQLGEDGWELVTVITYWPAAKTWIFKRKKPAP